MADPGDRHDAHMGDQCLQMRGMLFLDQFAALTADQKHRARDRPRSTLKFALDAPGIGERAGRDLGVPAPE